MSPELKEALARWLADATSEEPSGNVKRYGLCTNVGYGGTLAGQLDEALVADFGNHDGGPFGGWDMYCTLRDSNTQHLNPERLAWVRGKLA